LPPSPAFTNIFASSTNTRITLHGGKPPDGCH
jgi:hypothetical protein